MESTTSLSSSSWQQDYRYPIYGDPLWSAQGGGGTVDVENLKSFGAMGISPSLLANIQEADETGQPKQKDKLSQLQGSYDPENPPHLNTSPFSTCSDAGDGGDGGEEGDEETGPAFWNRFDHEKSDTRSIPIPPITVVPRSNFSMTSTTCGRPVRGEQSSRSSPASTATTTTTATSTKRTNSTSKPKGVTSAGVQKSRGVNASRRSEIDDMISRVMSRYNNSLQALTAKADKTQEEKEVRRILGNRDAVLLSRRKKNETITSLQSANDALSLELSQSQQSVQALTRLNEVQETRMRLLEERVRFVEGFLGGGDGSWRVGAGAGHGMGSAGGAAAAAATVGDGGELWSSTSGVSDVPADLFSWTDPVPELKDDK
ncbi:hypothetical protein L198_06613 [Cryptococcus wingfieldii CBS 7118]|uniref:BZIP domain-containing protein n=1 Tax=Cryptococcus wingfieldii CBS 7118 TaxID=1295528 RepID=A0A1E3IM77_9TREE|nr:hypothetical protein L198_06613 [Cryptococcus wingfieldii CBS 7118]ODN88811.1 hypothetical protein L198_06613 [Cryptococcus wingfieldii CBS 7118]